MTEVGLLLFARVALQVASVVLPRYRSRFSKHQFTPPQLLAIRCLMRYHDWIDRETEVLGEHGELRQVLGLRSVPNYTTVSLSEGVGRGNEVLRRVSAQEGKLPFFRGAQE